MTIESYDRDLHHMLPVIQAEDFVIVTDDHNAVSGIVTTPDVVGLYGERTLPFLLIGELDQELRQIMTTIDIDVIRSATGHNLQSHDDMTMGQYQRVLESPTVGPCLAGRWTDRRSSPAPTNSARSAMTMHFNPDGVLEDTVENLRRMLVLIREFGSLNAT